MEKEDVNASKDAWKVQPQKRFRSLESYVAPVQRNKERLLVGLSLVFDPGLITQEVAEAIFRPYLLYLAV